MAKANKVGAADENKKGKFYPSKMWTVEIIWPSVDRRPGHVFSNSYLTENLARGFAEREGRGIDGINAIRIWHEGQIKYTWGPSKFALYSEEELEQIKTEKFGPIGPDGVRRKPPRVNPRFCRHTPEELGL